MFISFETSFYFIFYFMVFLFFNKKVLSKLSYINVIISKMSFFNSFFLKNIFLMVMMMNLSSMIPYSFSFSSMFSVFLMSFTAWASLYMPLLFKMNKSMETSDIKKVIALCTCNQKLNKNNLAHFLPQSSPFVMSPFMITIEVVSLLARPMALGIRLMANITASHLLIHLFCHSMEHSSYFMFVLFMIFFILLIILETAVAFIQAYVFIMLLTLYTSEAN